MADEERREDKPEAYACCHLDSDIRGRSSSGGIFYLLGSWVLEQNGVVFGVQWNENWEAVHGEAHSPEELEAFMGSKYVQSSLGDTFLKVREYLEEGRLVLFSGTPCQAAGLAGFLARDYENLIVADIICHGVPSPKVWRRYLAEIRKNQTVKDIHFRDKTNGWRDFSLKIDYLSGRSYRKRRFADMYLRGFLKNMDLRPSCYACRFKAGKGRSDLTLGDFWGVERYCPDFSDDLGVSAVLVQSERGKMAFAGISDRMKIREIGADAVECTNTAYIRSVARPPERDAFFAELSEAEEDGTKQVGRLLRKYTKGTLRQRILARFLRK